MKKVMREFKEGELESGSGHPVRNREQAVAIGLSEARDKGARVPAPPKARKARKSG
ncbi:DUF6496 domain-containing protein [Hydrogenophaga sp.]|uniref:DUF6496 domain-containing protein n=1 Tax=Hydrogenophaga sp. TaxID=1904254 RepID=UPI003D152FEF